MRWWVRHLKYKELYEWYQQQPQPKAIRVNFRERVIRYWYEECKNKAHAEYRLNWWYNKDHEYKHNKRHLEIGDQIYFNSEIWEVQSYSMKKWYIVKSIVTWEEKRITTRDNHYRRNNSCIRFVKLENPVVLMRTKEKPQFEVKTDGEIFELTPPPKEEKKFSIDLDDLLNWCEYE